MTHPTPAPDEALREKIAMTPQPDRPMDREAIADANRNDAEEFCKGAFGPFVADVSQYVEIVAELLQHASDRAILALPLLPQRAALAQRSDVNAGSIAAACTATDEQAAYMVAQRLDDAYKFCKPEGESYCASIRRHERCPPCPVKLGEGSAPLRKPADARREVVAWKLTNDILDAELIIRQFTFDGVDSNRARKALDKIMNALPSPPLPGRSEATSEGKK